MQSQLATTQLVLLPNEGGQPLGIHVVPDYSPTRWLWCDCETNLRFKTHY
jgi:hypothetical protein